jgi:hypothetical protein
MGKTLEELFKTKVLDSGQTAEKKYDIRNSKDLPISPGVNALGLPFKAAMVARRNLSSKTKETFLEEEVTGLRVINTLSAPVTYGTDLIRLTKKSTKLVDAMKDGVNSNNPTDRGIVGNFIKKAENFGLKIAGKLGIAFPETTIPTRVSLNANFIAGREPDTMVTLAKIKNDSKGTLVGQFLAKNAKGTPKQIGNQLLGAGINFLKGEVKKKLFGAPKQGAQNLAKKGEAEVQYDSSGKYSDTVNPTDEDYFKRNDLSSILVAKDTKEAAGNTDITKRVNELVPKSKIVDVKTPLNIGKNPFAGIGDKLKDKASGITGKLSDAKKQGQQLLADGKAKVGDTKPDATATTPDPKITYSTTVDETQDDIKLRNDLSTKLDAMTAAASDLANGKGIGSSISRADVSTNEYSTLKNNQKEPKVSLKSKLGIDSTSKLDFLNEKVAYTLPAGETKLKLKDGTILDDYDFITLKFKSVAKGQAVNFRATVSGLSETVSPSWDSAKFIGSPFSYYTYSGIERSVTFSFKVYSTTPLQHIAAWQRINFLTSLAYPQGYGSSGIYVTPPFVELTLGNLYKNRVCFIESLSYNIDDNTPWEVGPTAASGIADDAKFKINGEDTSIDNYKLPKIIDVSITMKLVESKGNTAGNYLYGFDKLPRIAAAKGGKYSIEQTSTNETIADNANNAESIDDTQPTETQLPIDKTKSFSANENNPAQATTATNSGAGMEISAAPKVDPPPNYKVQVNKISEGFEGKVFANGKLIFDNRGLPFLPDYFTYGEDNKKYTGEAGVREYLRYKSKISGWTGNDGKEYAASNNIS